MNRSDDDVWVAQFDVLLLDLDGVVYAGPVGIEHAIDSLTRSARAGVRLAYVTNNASRTPRAVVQQLTGLGLHPSETDVVTSAQAGARLVREHLPAGASVLVVGGDGLREAVLGRDLRIVDTYLSRPEAVIVGFSPDTGWRELAQATYAVTGGALFVATNTDMTIPTVDGIAPGNGLLVDVVARATGVAPLVAGKPQLPLMIESVERTGASRPLVVGDRLDTDIAGARAANLPSLLVLTGVSSILDLLKAPPDQRPDYLARDLRALLDGPAALGLARDAAGASAGQRREGKGWLHDVATTATAVWAATDRGDTADVDAIFSELNAARSAL